MTLKVAIVGLGGIGNTHARVYKAREDVEIVAVQTDARDTGDAPQIEFDCAIEQFFWRLEAQRARLVVEERSRVGVDRSL